MTDQLRLFDGAPSVTPTVTYCHDCGAELSELDAIIPKTCLVRLDCAGCCTACHHAVIRQMATSPAETMRVLAASYRGFREARRR